MALTKSSPQLVERALDFTWSLWAQLGASGWRSRHQSWGIDPEPLVLFTAWLDDTDPRLRDESLDWCIKYGRYLSRSRLRNLVKTADENVRLSFGPFAATVNEHSNLSWPFATAPWKYKPTGGSHVRDFTDHALLALRLRALFGVSARAETIRVLMPYHVSLSASEIADRIDYTKRNVADALDALHLGGLVISETQGNAIRYRIGRHDVRKLVTPLPERFPFWKAIFRVVKSLLEIDAREEAFTKAARAVEARRVVEGLKQEIAAAGLMQPNLRVIGEDFWDSTMAWATDLVTGLAFGEPERVFEEGLDPIV